MFLRLLVDCVRAAASRTFCTAGTSSAIKMAIIAITTSSSIRVNACLAGSVLGIGIGAPDDKTALISCCLTEPEKMLMADGANCKLENKEDKNSEFLSSL